MAKGVHNATSGYRRGPGKNGGGPPGQPNNRTKKNTLSPKQARKRRAKIGLLAAGVAVYAAGSTYSKYGSRSANGMSYHVPLVGRVTNMPGRR